MKHYQQTERGGETRLSHSDGRRASYSPGVQIEKRSRSASGSQRRRATRRISDHTESKKRENKPKACRSLKLDEPKKPPEVIGKTTPLQPPQQKVVTSSSRILRMLGLILGSIGGFIIGGTLLSTGTMAIFYPITSPKGLALVVSGFSILFFSTVALVAGITYPFWS